jgi:hypothetical protein
MKANVNIVASIGLVAFSCLLSGCLSANLKDYGTPNMIVNRDFSDGLSNWDQYLAHGGKALITVESDVLHVAVLSRGRSPSDIQIGQGQPGLNCIEGKTYRVSFEAWSGCFASLTTAVGENGHDINHDGFAWSSHSYVSYFVTKSKRVFSSIFKMKGNNPNASLTFFCGVALSDLFIDNVAFVEVQE